MRRTLINLGIGRFLIQKFRKTRFEHFKDFFNTIPFQEGIRILDIGSTQEYWERMDFGIASEKEVEITLLNKRMGTTRFANFTFISGDARDLKIFNDKSFNIVFSNSVIEHLFTKEDQFKMANEVRRVGKSYYIQTPNYFFPIEPHWLFPFFQFLPFKVRVSLTRKFTLGNYSKAISEQFANQRIKRYGFLLQRK